MSEKEGIMTVHSEQTKQTKQEVAHVAYSIVAPVFNEEETLPHFYQRIVAVMEQVGESTWTSRAISRVCSESIRNGW